MCKKNYKKIGYIHALIGVFGPENAD